MDEAEADDEDAGKRDGHDPREQAFPKNQKAAAHQGQSGITTSHEYCAAMRCINVNVTTLWNSD